MKIDSWGVVFLEKKAFEFEIKATNDGTFEGYGAFFNNKDSYNDVIEKGAFKRTINNNMKRMKILWQHDTREPIGKPTKMFEDDNGLYIEAKLCMTDTGKKCYELMKEGIINELSIGYDAINPKYDPEKNIRYLKEIKLYEISAVTFAANEKAQVTSVKSFDDFIKDIKSGNLDQTKIDELIKLLKALQDNDKNIVEDPPNTENVDSEIFHSILCEAKKYI
jgi:HK97 family phage prohead protease